MLRIWTPKNNTSSPAAMTRLSTVPVTSALLLLDPAQQIDKIRYTPPVFQGGIIALLATAWPFFQHQRCMCMFLRLPHIAETLCRRERTREGSILSAPECISQMHSPQWEYWQDGTDRTRRRTARCMYYTGRGNATVMDGTGVHIGRRSKCFSHVLWGGILASCLFALRVS